jgi:hypothetical protein
VQEAPVGLIMVTNDSVEMVDLVEMMEVDFQLVDLVDLVKLLLDTLVHKKVQVVR